MDQYYWLSTRNAEKDFSSIKKWSFGEIMRFIISMEGKALKDKILGYFHFSAETPTNSSFNHYGKIELVNAIIKVDTEQ